MSMNNSRCDLFHHFIVSFSYKEGNQKLTDWKLKMAAIFQKELSIKLFFAEEILNYWSICSKCKKWQRAADDIVRNDIINPSWKCSMVCELYQSILPYLPIVKRAA